MYRPFFLLIFDLSFLECSVIWSIGLVYIYDIIKCFSFSGPRLFEDASESQRRGDRSCDRPPTTTSSIAHPQPLVSHSGIIDTPASSIPNSSVVTSARPSLSTTLIEPNLNGGYISFILVSN